MVQNPVTPRAVSAARSREALIDAALAVFARDGFDATPTDRIAEDAGVSPRTFFRYFPTKESVVFHRDYGFMRSFASAYLEQTVDAERLRGVAGDVRRAGGGLRRAARAHPDVPRRGRLLAGAPGSRAGALHRPRRTIAGAIARRRGAAEPDADAATLAAVALVLYQRALRRWLDGPPTRELGDLVDEEFRLLPRLVV